MHDSLEMKTLCGTWLVIRRELKQQAEETTEKRGEKKREREEKERESSARSRMTHCLCCAPAVAFWAALLSGCQADLSRWLASVSSLLKYDSSWGNLVQEKKQGTVRMNGMYVGCKENSPVSRSK